jgi:hypothetical protein
MRDRSRRNGTEEMDKREEEEKRYRRDAKVRRENAEENPGKGLTGAGMGNGGTE